MQVVFIIISLALLGVIIHFVVSPKSSRLLRLVAIVALGLIGLSLGICGVFLLRGPAEDSDAIALPFVLDPNEQRPAEKSNMPMIISFSVVFLIIAGLVVSTSLKERKKPKEPVRRAPAPRPVQNTGETTPDAAMEPDPISDGDDSFDLKIN